MDIELTGGYNSAGDKRFIVLRGTESQKRLEANRRLMVMGTVAHMMLESWWGKLTFSQGGLREKYTLYRTHNGNLCP